MGHGRVFHPSLRLMLGGLLALGALVLAIVVFGLSRNSLAADADTLPQVLISPGDTQVSPDDSLKFSLRVTNRLTETISYIDLKIEYDPALLEPVNSTFNHDGDWVSSLSADRLTLTLNDIGSKKTRGAEVFFHVKAPAPGNTAIDVATRYNWYVYNDAGKLVRSGSGKSSGDQALIVAPDGVQTNPEYVASQPSTAIDPISAPSGSYFHAYASGFAAGERVSIWLNTPSGVADVPHELYANDHGEVWPEFSSAGFGPGSYGLVIYGQESTQTLVVPFTLTGEPLPPEWNAGGGDTPQPPAPAPPVNIEPKAAPSGTFFKAYASGFHGGEGISIWLNTPAGVQGIDAWFVANDAGEVWPEFSSDGLAPGSYQLVIYGRDSGITQVVPFAIQ